jgi:tetratricopeptide (TPR) repeat protein
LNRLVTLTLASAALAGLLGCDEKPAVDFLAWSPTGAHVAFIRGREILVQDASGDSPVRSLAGAVPPAEPDLAWSRDGTSVIYTSAAKGSWDLWSVGVESGSHQRLTDHLARDCRPVVTPDGKSVVFLSDRSGRDELWCLDLATRDLKQITDGRSSKSHVLFASAADQLLYLARSLDAPATPEKPDGVLTLRRLDLAKGADETVAELASLPDAVEVSRDGRYVAILSEGTLSVLSAAKNPRGAVARKYDAPRALAHAVTGIDWDADGTSVVFSTGPYLMKVAASGGAPALLATLPTAVRLPRVSPSGGAVAAVVAPPADRPELAFLEEAVVVADAKGKRRAWLGRAAQLATAAWTAGAQRRFDEEKAILLRLQREAGDKGEPQVTRELVDVELHLGRPQAALDLCLNRLHDPQKAAEVAFFHLEDFAKAKELLARSDEGRGSVWSAVLAQDDKAMLRLVAAAERSLREGDFARAVDSRLTLVRNYPASPLAQTYAFDAADVARRSLNDPKKALALYLSAAGACPESPRTFGAWIEAGDLCRFQLSRPAEAIEHYVRASASARTDADRLKAALRRIDFHLALEPESGRAMDVVRELCSTLSADESARAEAVIRVVAAFDRLLHHDGANSALELMMKSPGLHASDVTEIVFSLGGAPRDEFVGRFVLKADVSALPPWALRRAAILRPFVDENFRFAADLADLLSCTDAGSVEKFRAEYLAKHKARLDADRTGTLVRDAVEALCDYVVGNRLQSEGKTREALARYVALCARGKSLGASDLSAYGLVLKSRLALDPAEDKALAAYMDIERETGAGFWRYALAFSRYVRREGEPPPASAPARPTTWEGSDARLFYLAFLRDFPASRLAGDAEYRVAEMTRGAERLDALERAMTSHPESPHFGPALSDYEDAAVESGYAWRAARFCEELASKPADPQRQASVRLTAGRLYQDVLKQPGLAQPVYESIAKDSPRVPAWAEAEHRAGLNEFGRKDYAQALERFRRLSAERPDYSWVRSGDCLYYTARCCEALDRWNEAQAAFLELINRFRDNPRVADGSLLLEIFPHLDESARKDLIERRGADVDKILPRLDPWEQEKVRRLKQAIEGK